MSSVTSSSPTTLDLLTLFIAAIGVLSGVAALILQRIHFARSGPVVAVTFSQAWQGGSGAITAPFVNGVNTSPPPSGYGGMYWATKVVNSGRAATTVERVGVDLGGKAEFWEPEPPFGPPHGARLEAESSETWFGQLEDVLAGVHATSKVFGAERRVRAFAQLGSGRMVYSAWVSI